MTILNQLSAMARDAIRSVEVAALRAIRPAPTPPTVEVAALLAHCAEALNARDAAEAELRSFEEEVKILKRILAEAEANVVAVSKEREAARLELDKLYAVLGVSCIESAREIVAKLNDVLGVSNLWEARKVAGQLKAGVVLSAIKGEENCVELAQAQAQAKTAKALADEVFAVFGVTNVFELREVVLRMRREAEQQERGA